MTYSPILLHLYWDINPVIGNGAYSQESRARIALILMIDWVPACTTYCPIILIHINFFYRTVSVHLFLHVHKENCILQVYFKYTCCAANSCTRAELNSLLPLPCCSLYTLYCLILLYKLLLTNTNDSQSSDSASGSGAEPAKAWLPVSFPSLPSFNNRRPGILWTSATHNYDAVTESSHAVGVTTVTSYIQTLQEHCLELSKTSP